ncbi:MAG: bifunctional ornithine acetyltransferase/N-acetylglutamate synthase, partial [Candidatus Altiarchaeales archaeon]|nr:bifunctional ornithine acetyltransferase/N-acetylglutamate synthase [Candidatus Altiarchaeales archaeon]
KKIARDGEGASKYLEFEVTNAKNDASAAKVAKAIASSPLVNAAFYGENPNWGRIISTIGSKIKFNPMETTIKFSSEKGGVNVFNQGTVGNLKKAVGVLKAKEIKVTVNLRQGRGSAKAYTCDLTEKYVRINAGYS